MVWDGVQTYPGNGNSTTYAFVNVHMDGNSISNIVGTPHLVCNGVYFRSAYNGTANNNYISGVGFNWNNSLGTAGPDGIGVFDSAQITANSNVVLDVYSPGPFDGNGIDFDQSCYNSTFMYNFVSGCYGTGLLCYANGVSGNVAAFNIFADNGLSNYGGGIVVTGAGTCKVYNNTVIQLTSTQPALLIGTAAQSGQVILNNLFVTPSGSTTINIPSGSGLVLEGNAYLCGTGFNCTYNSTAYTTLASFRSASGQESPANGFSLTSNPCLKPSPIPTVTTAAFGAAEAYSLVSGSSLLTGGLNISTGYSITPPSTDIFGTPITASTLPVGAVKAALSYTLAGPTTGPESVASSNFTITPSVAVNDTITLSDASGGGTFTPSSLTISGTTPVPFTYTNSSAGAFTLSATSALGAAITNSPASYTTTASFEWTWNQSAIKNTVSASSSANVTIGNSTDVARGDVLVVGVTLQRGPLARSSTIWATPTPRSPPN